MYFNAVVRHWHLANVHVRAAKGSAPVTILNDAVAVLKRRRIDAQSSPAILPYDEIWCVFDVDEHPKMDEALKIAEKHDICVGLSNPCFEYWLLLHYERFAQTNNTRHQIQDRMKKHIDGYKKGGDYSASLIPRIMKAVEHSRHVWKAQWKNTSPTARDVLNANPSTLVHILVESLSP
jgi:hypothetical protein